MPKAQTTTNTSGNLLEKLVPILLLASVVLAFVVGMLWQKVSLLQNGAGLNAGAQAGTENAAPPTDPSGKLTADQAKKIDPVSDKDHIRGNKDAKVVLIEYSDLECPFCKQFHPTAQQIKADYGDDIAWVWRHFPLEQIHPKARPAAEASECVASLVGEDGFWKFVDAIFADQATALADLSGTAVKVGANKAAFDKCVADGKGKALIDQQIQKGLEAGINGTPGNIIINKKGDAWLIPGALPLASMKTTVDEALQ